MPLCTWAWDRPFNNASNWGGTGLLEIPTARVLEDGVLRIGYTQHEPYRAYNGGMGIFPGLELTGRFTEFTSISSGLGASYNEYATDKAFDIKYQLVPESKRLPAMAIGWQDFHGTQLFESQYIAISRQIFPLDFTIGIGRQRLKGPLELPYNDQLGIWGGLEWSITQHVHLMAEYNPVEYEKDIPSRRAVPEGAESPFNFGMRVKLLPGIDLALSYQRGDTIGLMAHVNYLLGKPLVPKRPDPPRWRTAESAATTSAIPQAIVRNLQQAIEEAEFKDVAVTIDSTTLTAEIENTKYLSVAKAAGRVLRVLYAHAPQDIDLLVVILKKRQIPFLKVSVNPDHLNEYLFARVDDDVIAELLKVESFPSARSADAAPKTQVVRAEPQQRFPVSWGVKPELNTFLNDPAGLIQYRVGVQPHGQVLPWKGAVLSARYEIPLHSDIQSTNVPPPEAVRSDYWKYLNDEPRLEQAMFDQVFQLLPRTLGRIGGGYLEAMYAGISGEALTFLNNSGTLAASIESAWVKKRDPQNTFELLDFERYTLLGNLYFRVPGLNVIFNAKYGRFLGKDTGWRFEVSRELDTGAVFGAWLSFTDTDVFNDEFNKDYNDKGVFIQLPVRSFTNYETNARYGYSLSPWTRDVAALPGGSSGLFNLGYGLMPGYFKEKIKDLKD